MRLFFERHKLLVTPALLVSSVPAGRDVPVGYKDRSPVSRVYDTCPFNLTGYPAVSLCAGLAADGMPVGLQIVGRPCRKPT